jgi:hypothetical protein
MLLGSFFKNFYPEVAPDRLAEAAGGRQATLKGVTGKK